MSSSGGSISSWVGGHFAAVSATVIAVIAAGAGVALVPTITGDAQPCAQTTANIPDGPDPWGGCFPGPSNTGPNASEASMADYSGSCTINTPNVTIDSKVVDCETVTIGSAASGLLIKNSYVKGGVISEDGATFEIRDSLVDNAQSYPACSGPNSEPCSAGLYACGDPNNQTTECGVGYSNFTILRTEILNTNRAAYCRSTCLVQDSYFHGTNLWPDFSNRAHASSLRQEQYTTATHNSLSCDYQGPTYGNVGGDLGCSADLSGYPDFVPIHHTTASNNLFVTNTGSDENHGGAGFCAYAGATGGKDFSNDPDNATYMVFTNNVFQKGANPWENGKCGSYGHVADFNPSRTGNVWSGNIFDDGTTAGSS